MKMFKISSIVDKGRQVIDLTKMGAKIEKEEENIEKLYANLGRVFYKTHDKAPEVMYEDLFRTISGVERQLKYLKNEALILSGKYKCQKCDNDLKPTDLYCSSCGEAAEKIIEKFQS